MHIYCLVSKQTHLTSDGRNCVFKPWNPHMSGIAARQGLCAGVPTDATLIVVSYQIQHITRFG
jgi:hypothetical protein